MSECPTPLTGYFSVFRWTQESHTRKLLRSTNPSGIETLPCERSLDIYIEHKVGDDTNEGCTLYKNGGKSISFRARHDTGASLGWVSPGAATTG